MLARSLLFSLVIAGSGCKAGSDLGKQCQMVKRDPNVDGGRLFILNKEIKVGANKDFISFGAVDCEDLVCVRDSDFAATAGADPEGIAFGYCSRQCAPATVCAAEKPSDDNDAKLRLSCRALLLDAETLAALCNGSPEDRAKCEAYLGNVESPYFCARGSAADAGI